MPCWPARAWPTARRASRRINFVGHRHLIDRMLDAGMLPGRLGYRLHLLDGRPRLGAEPGGTRRGAGHVRFRRGCRLVRRPSQGRLLPQPSRPCAPMWPPGLTRCCGGGVRVNAICPGPTVTPLAEANKELWLEFGADYRADAGVEASTPMEQAYPLLVPVQRRGRLRHRRDADRRRRLHERGTHRRLPGRRRRRQVPGGPLVAILGVMPRPTKRRVPAGRVTAKGTRPDNYQPDRQTHTGFR